MLVSHGVLFNDLANHFAGAELVQMWAAYIAMIQVSWFVESMRSQAQRLCGGIPCGSSCSAAI